MSNDNILHIRTRQNIAVMYIAPWNVLAIPKSILTHISTMTQTKRIPEIQSFIFKIQKWNMLFWISTCSTEKLGSFYSDLPIRKFISWLWSKQTRNLLFVLMYAHDYWNSILRKDFTSETLKISVDMLKKTIIPWSKCH